MATFDAATSNIHRCAVRVIAMIPARSGSRGCVNKNLRECAGKPLIAHTIAAAQQCPEFEGEVWVNSDSELCLDLAQAMKVLRYKRPAELATDTASMLDVVKNFAASLQGDVAIAVLYPTYALRTASDISAMIRAFDGRPLIGVTKPKTHPFLCVTVDDDKRPTTVLEHGMFRRQDFPAMWEVTHSACVLPLSCIDRLDDRLMAPDSMAWEVPGTVVDVDEQADLEYAGWLMERGA